MTVKNSFRIDVQYSGDVDLVKFYERWSSPRGQERYWRMDLSEFLYGEEQPYRRAWAFVLSELVGGVTDGFNFSREDGVHLSPWSGDPDISTATDDDFDEGADDPAWLELIAAHPWLEFHPDDVPEDRRPVDPGGTAPLF